MHAVVDLTFDPSEGRFALPASGTRSLLFRFGDIAFGGVLTSTSDVEFKPGAEHIGATLELWHGDSSPIAVGAKFVVWYGGDVGHGIVTSNVGAQEPLESGRLLIDEIARDTGHS